MKRPRTCNKCRAEGFGGDGCQLGYNNTGPTIPGLGIPSRAPQEPCLKPLTIKELIEADRKMVNVCRTSHRFISTAAEKHAWTKTKPMWVAGYIDDRGAIAAKASTSRNDCVMHDIETSRGHRWRWNVWGQEYHATLGKQDLTNEELGIVNDWLDKNGYVWHEVG